MSSHPIIKPWTMTSAGNIGSFYNKLSIGCQSMGSKEPIIFRTISMNIYLLTRNNDIPHIRSIEFDFIWSPSKINDCTSIKIIRRWYGFPKRSISCSWSWSLTIKIYIQSIWMSRNLIYDMGTIIIYSPLNKNEIIVRQSMSGSRKFCSGIPRAGTNSPCFRNRTSS